MALEIAGSRIVTPIFGSTTYTWGILIGVILTGLTVGYHLGGKIADINPNFQQTALDYFQMPNDNLHNKIGILCHYGLKILPCR